jgi:1,4-alpha-glucan branching enzyme
MGSEWAQSGEWNHAASLDWHLCQYMDHEGVRRLVIDLNRLYAAEPALGANDFNPHGFRWINCTDADANVVAYLRTGPTEETLFVVVGHFGGATRRYRVGVPRLGWWREVINSNSEYYGGSGLGNDGGRAATGEPRDGYTQSIDLTLPPLTTLVFKWTAGG